MGSGNGRVIGGHAGNDSFVNVSANVTIKTVALYYIVQKFYYLKSQCATIQYIGVPE